MLLSKYLPRTEFDSYEDFKENYKVNAPLNFNFGYDVVDAWAESEPEKRALVWCDDHEHEHSFTFAEISRMSNRAANYFRDLGVTRGTVVMLILRRRWEYWICATALHKLGAVLIPGSLQLTKKDLVYRANAAGIQTIICVDDAFVIEQVENAMQETDVIKNRILVDEKRDGWHFFNDEIMEYPDTLSRVDTSISDTMLVYFTSGTTGMPKMVAHNFSY
ncbi:MAG: AMP-binding protein, partial [Clostridia bacterium]